MNPKDELTKLLEVRDEILASSSDAFEPCILEQIESEEIRVLGKIVLETASEDMTVYSTT